MKFGIYDTDSVRIFEELKDRITEQREGFENSYDWVYFNARLPQRRIVKIWPGEIDHEMLDLFVVLARSAGDSGLFFDLGGSVGYCHQNKRHETNVQHFYIPIDRVKYALSIGIPREIFIGYLRGKDFDFQGASLFFSEKCGWAIAYTPIAEYALLAGTDAAAIVFDQWQSKNDDYYSVQEFLKDLSDHECGFKLSSMNGFYDWQLRLMIHAYGRNKAVDLMRRFDLISD